ncbi:MAG: restriction endonuclease [Micromonosporaceae bacterium]|nr:restriction endonuclease [Micromonosporaceae bacterium]
MARRSRSADLHRRWEAERRAAERARAAAAREEERQRKLAEKERREAYVKGRGDETANLTADVDRRMNELGSVLAVVVEQPARGLDFQGLKKAPPRIALDLGADAQPIPPPSWGQFAPAPPGLISRMFGGEARYARDRAVAQQRHAAAVEQHRHAEGARQARVVVARKRHAAEKAAAAASVAKQHAEMDRFEAAVKSRDRHAVSRYFQLVIDQLKDLRGFPKERRAGYVPESSLLALEWRLPNVEIVPDKKAFRYVKTRDAIESTVRPVAEIRKTYQQLVAQIALRALYVVFGADAHQLVSTVVFNGMVRAIDPSTGQTIERCLITLRATRDQFEQVVLRHVDPVACVRKYFAADVSPHPEELQEVPPVMSFNMADPRIIDPVDIISGIDKRPNLLELKPKDFEHFVHNLFTKMGLDTKIFKADGDGGVDCVAYDPKPVFGGKYVIQAKLYNITVPPAAVRDLYGTMQHEGATKGILITTSGYGPSSYEFANGKPLQLIDGSGLLALCKDLDIPARIVPTSKSRTK